VLGVGGPVSDVIGLWCGAREVRASAAGGSCRGGPWGRYRCIVGLHGTRHEQHPRWRLRGIVPIVSLVCQPRTSAQAQMSCQTGSDCDCGPVTATVTSGRDCDQWL